MFSAGAARADLTGAELVGAVLVGAVVVGAGSVGAPLVTAVPDAVVAGGAGSDNNVGATPFSFRAVETTGAAATSLVEVAATGDWVGSSPARLCLLCARAQPNSPNNSGDSAGVPGMSPATAPNPTIDSTCERACITTLSGAGGPVNTVGASALAETGLTVAGGGGLSGWWTIADDGARRSTAPSVLTVLCPTTSAVGVDGDCSIVAVLLAVGVDARLPLFGAGAPCCSKGGAVDLVCDGSLATGGPGVAAEADEAVW